jgi:hypothetical protein
MDRSPRAGRGVCAEAQRLPPCWPSSSRSRSSGLDAIREPDGSLLLDDLTALDAAPLLNVPALLSSEDPKVRSACCPTSTTTRPRRRSGEVRRRRDRAPVPLAHAIVETGLLLARARSSAFRRFPAPASLPGPTRGLGCRRWNGAPGSRCSSSCNDPDARRPGNARPWRRAPDRTASQVLRARYARIDALAGVQQAILECITPAVTGRWLRASNDSAACPAAYAGVALRGCSARHDTSKLGQSRCLAARILVRARDRAARSPGTSQGLFAGLSSAVRPSVEPQGHEDRPGTAARTGAFRRKQVRTGVLRASRTHPNTNHSQ